MDPKTSVKVSRECSTIFKFVNISQVGRGMSRERNEHPVESEMEDIRRISIYWHTAFSKKKKKKKRQWYRYHTYWYRYHPSKKRQRKWAKLGFFFPILTPFHTPTPPSPYKINPTLIFPLIRANPRSSILASVSISLIQIPLSSSHRRGKRPSVL